MMRTDHDKAAALWAIEQHMTHLQMFQQQLRDAGLEEIADGVDASIKTWGALTDELADDEPPQLPGMDRRSSNCPYCGETVPYHTYQYGVRRFDRRIIAEVNYPKKFFTTYATAMKVFAD